MHKINLIKDSFLALKPIEVVFWGVGFFLSIYLLAASLVWLLAKAVNRPIETKPIRADQIFTESMQSIRSILIFGVGILVPWMMLKFKIASFANTTSVVFGLAEVFILILWNDVHFYAAHRLLHYKFKKLHLAHHLSITATPFTAYSMGMGEAMVYGSVLPIAMLFHDFSFLSLVFLPIWSITINTLAHSNCDLFPNAGVYSLLGLVKHHQSHHSKYHGNYSFFFIQLDRYFNTTQKNKIGNL